MRGVQSIAAILDGQVNVPLAGRQGGAGEIAARPIRVEAQIGRAIAERPAQRGTDLCRGNRRTVARRQMQCDALRAALTGCGKRDAIAQRALCRGPPQIVS